jgi:hypothetical protein
VVITSRGHELRLGFTVTGEALLTIMRDGVFRVEPWAEVEAAIARAANLAGIETVTQEFINRLTQV